MVHRSTANLVAATVIAATAVVLAGCGTTNPYYNHIGATARGASRARAMDAASDAAVAGVKNLQSQLTTFSGTCDFVETDRAGNVQTNTVNVSWAAPEKIRADITASSDGMRDGASMVYLGGTTIEAKKFFVHQTFSVTDPKALSLRGYRIDQTDIKFLLGTLTNAQDTVVSGTAPNVYEVTGAGLLPTTSREEVTLNPTTFAPVKIEFFDGDKSCYRIKLSSVKINPKLASDVFNL